MPQAFIDLTQTCKTYEEWKKAFYDAKYNLEYGVAGSYNIYQESVRLAKAQKED